VDRKKASQVGIVSGVVLIAIGFGYGNSGTSMLGVILLALGVWLRIRRS
jgi:uncharacterized protein (TIGR03382 family)